MARARPAEGVLKVLIVEDDTLVGMGLRSQLEKIGHQVVGQAATAAQGLEMFRAENPDLVLIDIRLDGDDGLELAERISSERRVPMIIVSAYSEREQIERAAGAGVFGYLIKPVSDRMLEAQINVATERFAEREQLWTEKAKLAQDLETRKVLDRAKAVLIKRAGLTEEEAHKRLQQESQKRRIALADLCRRVIESDELLGGP